MSTFKKLFASITAIMVVASTLPVAVLGQVSYGAEIEGAYDYAADAGMTTMPTIESFRPFDGVTRAELAKMMSVYATDKVGLEADEDMAACEDFSDLDMDSMGDLYAYSVMACQLGLMGLNADGSVAAEFNPNGSVTRAQFGTVFSRMLRGNENNLAAGEEGTWYGAHLEALNDAGIMNNIDNPMQLELRGYIALMAQRADENGLLDADMNDDADCDELTAAQELACLLDLPDCPVGCGSDDQDNQDEDEDEDEDDNFVTVDGELEITLSDQSPDSADVPKGAVVTAAAFDLTADTDEDVNVTNLVIKRTGLGNSSTLGSVAAYGEGKRLSRSRSFNSDDEATLTFNPALTIRAGETETIYLVVEVGTATGIEGQKFSLTIAEDDSISANADVDGNFPIKSAAHEISSVSAADVTIDENGAVSAVELGDTQAEIAKFKITNDESSNEVYIQTITLEDEQNNIDDNMENFALYADGKLVAAVDSTNNQYVTFELDDPLMIDESDTVKFVVKADVIAGVGDTVKLVLDTDLDLRGYDDDYGFGLNVNNLFTTGVTVTITAGELTLVAIDADKEEVRPDTDNVVLGQIRINVNAGQDLELKDFFATITTSVSGDTIAENIELVDTATKSAYTLATTLDNDLSTDISDTDLYIPLPDGGSKTFTIRADILSTAPADATIELSMSPANVTATDIREAADDEEVTSKTPSSLSWKDITVVDSSVTVNMLTLSDINGVIGSKDIPALSFQVQANDAGDVTIDEITMTGDTNFASTHVAAISLYEGSVDASNLLETKAGFDITSSTIVFDDFDEVDIASNSKKKFVITVDLVDATANADDTIDFTLSSVEGEDEDNDDITTTVTGTSGRTITVKSAGTLTVTTDNTDTETNNEEVVLGNSTSDRVASFEFVATNEAVQVEDLNLILTGTNATTGVAAIDEVMIYANDKTTLLATESLVSTTTNFDQWAEDFIVEVGSENIYIKVTTEKIGYQAAGKNTANLGFALDVVEAEGVSSNKDASVTDTNSTSTASTNFDIASVKVGTPAVVALSSTTLKNDAWTTVARVKLTAEATTNTDADDGSSLDTLAETLVFTVDTYTNLTGTVTTGDFRLKRTNPLDGSSNTLYADSFTTSSNAVTSVTFDLSDASFSTNDQLNSNGVTYEVEVSIPVISTTTDAYFAAELGVGTTAVVYGDDDDLTGQGVVITEDIEFGELRFVGSN